MPPDPRRAAVRGTPPRTTTTLSGLNQPQGHDAIDAPALTSTGWGSPMSDAEREAARRVGSTIRQLRYAAGLTAVEAADKAQLSQSQFTRIEDGSRRFRRSTGNRIVAALAPDDATLGEQRQLLERLVQLAGPALADEPRDPERVERERVRSVWRRRQSLRDEALALVRRAFEERSGGGQWPAWIFDAYDSGRPQ